MQINETITVSEIKTTRRVSGKDMISAIQNSMGPIFEHFGEKLAEGDGKTLHIQISAKGDSVKLNYGVTEIEA